ncbi:hypothetical protein [Shewanella algae]|uniref:hypothetical protein n=1 Tax=Shewanella algae TaxID=38313 RepID=UPI0005CD4435|nr:hypothetical protein [Shewanella algae]
MKVISKLVGIVAISWSSLSFAEESAATEIDQVMFNADYGTIFAYKDSGWGVCNNTKFVQLRGNESHKDKFISLVLSAHMAKKKVKFLGGCTNANGYFDGMYITIY